MKYGAVKPTLNRDIQVIPSRSHKVLNRVTPPCRVPGDKDSSRSSMDFLSSLMGGGGDPATQVEKEQSIGYRFRRRSRACLTEGGGRVEPM